MLWLFWQVSTLLTYIWALDGGVIYFSNNFSKIFFLRLLLSLGIDEGSLVCHSDCSFLGMVLAFKSYMRTGQLFYLFWGYVVLYRENVYCTEWKNGIFFFIIIFSYLPGLKTLCFTFLVSICPHCKWIKVGER